MMSEPSTALPSYIEIIDGDSPLRSQSSVPPPDTETDDCPKCCQSLPVSEFGICRARNTGRNLYCKECLRKNVADKRRAFRDWKESKKDRASQESLPLIGLAPAPPPSPRDPNVILLGIKIRNPDHPHHERVLGAIHQGARTQREIMNAIRPVHYSPSEGVSSPATGLAMDQVGDSLALLMFSQPRKVASDVVEGRRVYVPAVPSLETKGQYGNASFSALGGLLAPVIKGRAA